MNAGYYGRGHVRERFDDACEKADKAQQEHQEAKSELARMARKLIEARNSLSSVFSEDALTDSKILLKVADFNKVNEKTKQIDAH